MQFLKQKKHEAVELFRFGFSPVGKPYINVYCYYLDGLLIDTAQRNCEKKVIETFQNKKIEKIILTHWHEDHTGNVATLAKKHQAQVFAHPITQEIIKTGFKIHPYEHFLFGKIKSFKGQMLDNQEIIETNNYKLLPIFAPGHSDDHTVFLEQNNGWLFSGDLWVTGKTKYFRKGENFWQQVESLKKVLHYDFEVLFCGHHPRLKNGKEEVKKKLQYFEDFGGKVISFHQKGLNSKQIIKALGKRENLLLNALLSFDVSLEYMIDSIITS